MSMMLVLLLGMAGCSSSQQEQTKQAEVHVCVDGSDDSGKGTPNEPYATVSAAAEAAPGSVIIVHDNVIADCKGYVGICFGGYDLDLGFTENCAFEHNTLVDNASHIGVQRSKNNRVSANLIVGGEVAVEFSEECRQEDMVNDISGNAFCDIEDEESWTAEYGAMHQDRSEVIDGFRSLVDGVGSSFVPDEEQMALYHS